MYVLLYVFDIILCVFDIQGCTYVYVYCYMYLTLFYDVFDI